MKRMGKWALAGAALGCVALQFGGSLALTTLALALWLAVLAWHARPQLRRLWMPKFWAISLAFALASGLWLGVPDMAVGPLRLSRKGLAAGALMLVRGALIYSLMGWASSLMVDRRVRAAMARLGLAEFGAALSAAFAMIPGLADIVVPAVKAQQWSPKGLARLHELGVMLVLHAVDLGRSLESQRPFIAAVVGERGSGKTSAIRQLCAKLAAEGYRVGGVLQPANELDGVRVGYRLRDAATGEELEFAVRGPNGFEFAAQGWLWARARLHKALAQADCTVIDELGLLEARGQGHLLELPRLPAWMASRVLLVAVRQDCAAAVEQRLGPFAARIHPQALREQGEPFLEQLRRQLRPMPAHAAKETRS